MDDAGAYDDALGGHGWAEYRRLITQAWQKNPSGWHEKYLMQELLRSAGDVDALVAVYAAELLPSGYTHLMIAQEFDEVGRADEALEWAERGLREAAGSLDARLVDYLAARYEATGAFGKALAARQNAFDTGRTLASYRALRDAAAKPGNGSLCASVPCSSCEAMPPRPPRIAARALAGARARCGSAR